MTYRQITASERYTVALLHGQGWAPAAIAATLGRHRSTVGRELQRNHTAHDGWYRAEKAHSYATARRARSRRNQRFGPAAWQLVRARLAEGWSPEQIAGRLAVEGTLSISHETIYRHIWDDRARGGVLYLQLRGARKQRRKRYGRYDSRGRLAGKRAIADRPPGAEHRTRLGHLEGDTVMGSPDHHCILTLVDRKSGYTMIGKLAARTVAATTRRAVMLIRTARRPVRTITVDNGTEFHGYRAIEHQTAARFYFATPHHAWERGTNENTNGLIRQYLPKGQSMRTLTQPDCHAIARRLNRRPRKRLGYRTPEECYVS
ncbi:MAG: IS30 family transposase [Gemmatimonadales bacterium]